ncbi:hypothetical protein ABER99_20205 [Paenibacillus glucanolyticus]|jgi:uncharacterized protein (DUF983 family)|uniref:Uncharacterized protein n=1 Tax=Paenibacillus glucanolyticus TaxID=59843 RepID=A0A163GKW2_9BACL|nr:hypothetical protein [Paenibacillus glucanolyticus]KZS45027.1 hypothetical protein AWU65_03330 [Paenibacillus glucanolyticus]OMF66736.1 hypothetical protein BK142_29385 [Paenibacillus glucanolyticus]
MRKRFRVKLSSCTHCGADYQNSQSSYLCDEVNLDKHKICGNCQIGKLFITDVIGEVCVLCGELAKISDKKNKCNECEAKFELAAERDKQMES